MAATVPSPGPGPAPRVTVVLLTYNHAPFIAEALDSVLMQETTFPVELIVVEDCSTDGTQDILRRYQAQHPERIRLVLAASNQNDNLAWGQAIVGARGDYVALLDGDDYWTSPRKLQAQVEFLDAHRDHSICFHDVTVVRTDGQPPTQFNSPHQRPRATIAELCRSNFMATGSVMYRRGLVTAAPGWLNSLPFGDWPMHLLFAQQGDVGYLRNSMGVYRVHAGGIYAGAAPRRRAESVLAFLDDIEPHFPAQRREFGIGRAGCLYALSRALLEEGDVTSAGHRLATAFKTRPFVANVVLHRRAWATLVGPVWMPRLWRRLARVS